jgi:hypothetical protein
MNLLDIYTAAHNTQFQNRCRVAAWIAAQDIASEDVSTPNHETRMDWSKRALQDNITIKPHQLAMQVLRNPVIAADPAGAADGDIQFQVNSVIDAIIAIG